MDKASMTEADRDQAVRMQCLELVLRYMGNHYAFPMVIEMTDHYASYVLSGTKPVLLGAAA